MGVFGVAVQLDQVAFGAGREVRLPDLERDSAVRRALHRELDGRRVAAHRAERAIGRARDEPAVVLVALQQPPAVAAAAAARTAAA